MKLRTFFKKRNLIVVTTSLLWFQQSYSLGVMPQLSESTDLKRFSGAATIENTECSAAIFQFEGAQSQQKALILTSGLCARQGLKENQFIMNQDSPSYFIVSAFNDDGVSNDSFGFRRALYIAQAPIDIALFEMEQTYAELAAKGIHPFILATQKLQIPFLVDVVSGYWSSAVGTPSYVDHVSVDGSVHKLDVAAPWAKYTLNNLFRLSQFDAYETLGDLGAPLLEAGTRKLVGVQVMANTPGSGNIATEVDENAKRTLNEKTSYGESTWILNTCVNAVKQFDINLAGCLLPH